VRGERDKYRHHRNKSESRSNNHLEQGEIDSSDSDRENRTKRQERWDEHQNDNKDRERSSERDPSDRHGRWRGSQESRHTSDEDGELVEKERGEQERERKYENGNRQRENGNGGRARDKSSEEHDERLRRSRHESGHRRRENEDGRRNRDSHSRHYSERKDEREERRTSERKRDSRDDGKQSRYRNRDDDGDLKYRGDKEVNERREDNERDGRMLENSKPQGRSTLQEGNPNTDMANLGKSGGVYIPPYKLARMMKEVEDKSSVEYQRLTWDALRKSINGLVNKVNAANIKNIIPEIFAENLIRGRGLFCRSCMKSQMASPGFTDVFAGLVAVVNTKFPEVGELLLRRIVLQLKRAFKRNDKVCFSLFVIHSIVLF
jgi:pre-mRNA-splicing factor CWC22